MILSTNIFWIIILSGGEIGTLLELPFSSCCNFESCQITFSRLYPRSLVFHINQAQPFLLSFLSQIFSNCVLFRTISCKYCKIVTFSERKVLLQINSNCVLFRTINSKLSNCQTMPISERKIMLYKKFNFCPYQKKNML